MNRRFAFALSVSQIVCASCSTMFLLASRAFNLSDGSTLIFAGVFCARAINRAHSNAAGIGIMPASRIASGQLKAAQGFELNVISAGVRGGTVLVAGLVDPLKNRPDRN